MNRDNIAETLVFLRGKKSQKQVADDLGISQAAMCAYESGARVPRDELKLKIAEYYNTSVQAIFFA